MVMQCPALQDRRCDMFHDIERICGACEHDQISIQNERFLTLMGRPNANIPVETMVKIWECSARHIANMYLWKIRVGIG